MLPTSKPSTKTKFSIELDAVDVQNLLFLKKTWRSRSKIQTIAQALSIARGLVENGAVIKLVLPEHHDGPPH